MPPRDFAARKDTNHNEITAALDDAGYIVVDTYRQGDGCPDCFVLSKSRIWVAMEIKSGFGGLTRMETELFNRVGAGPLYTIPTPEAALQIMAHYDNKTLTELP